ncbi:SDR family NAD(P)-dependent oxidoreductase [Mycobacterium sp. TY814]|uniref:SDR family NAD(P)-dependent oxidoreductase n=1 Tax=unclassified Mycobacterium TaxID=2642494 RepID=UPI0027410327|nr:SDR family NAD(P)-dependent oxidoreductase [Mycobacterium sp. TY814]MDP7721761.1 SDR family NAD(P)-dependent oxidoreductase [Mycobacterium sp. TY814]
MKAPAYDVRGKVVLITGGTGGIGSATARELLRRGAKVAIADLDPQTPEIGAAMSSNSAMGLVADVRARETLDAAIDAVVDRFGRLDIAIANAGILAQTGTLRTTPLSSVESLLAVNVTGVVNTVQAAIDQVIATRGQIALLSSVFAFANGMGTIPYAMTKAAVEQLGRGLRVELANHGVSTLVAYFSMVHTAMITEGVDGDPLADQLLATMPQTMLKRIAPETAATALVDGLARRSPTVFAPSRWKPLSALRGLVNPMLDSRMTRDLATQAALSALDARPATKKTAESKGTR